MYPLSPLAMVGGLVSGAAALVTAATKDGSFLSFLNAPGESADQAPAASATTADWSAKLQPIADAIREQLQAAGIDLATPVTLSVGISGTIEASSDHPQWREIEEVLRRSPGLAAELTGLLSAAEQSSDDFHPQAQLAFLPDQDVLLLNESIVGSAVPKSDSNFGA